MKKKLFPIIAITYVMFFSFPIFASDIVNITIDNIPLETDVPAQIINGRTFVPMRAIFEALEADINYDTKTKIITAKRNDNNISIQIGAPVFYINGTEKQLDVPACIINERTFVPVRAISESLECEIKWDPQNKSVAIETNSINVSQNEDIEVSKEEIGKNDWVTMLTQEDSSPKPISDSEMTEEEAQLHQKARYNFEQSVLPKNIYENKEFVESIITNTPDKFETFINSSWLTTITYATAEELGINEKTLSNMSEEEIEELNKKGVDLALKCHLDQKENFHIRTVKDDDYYYALLEMADDFYITSCKYILIRYSPENGFKYFTLEKTFGDNKYVVCEVFQDGRGNHGFFIDGADKTKFLEYISNNE